MNWIVAYYFFDATTEFGDVFCRHPSVITDLGENSPQGNELILSYRSIFSLCDSRNLLAC